MLKQILFSCVIIILAAVISPVNVAFSVPDEPEISEKHRKRKRCKKCRPYSLHKRESLRFGKIVPSENSMGIVTIDPRTGDKIITGGVFDLGKDSGAAVFEIRARPGSQFNVTSLSEIRMRPKNRGVSIQDIKIWPEGVLNVGLSERMEFNVGGSLHLPQRAKAGKYKARIPVFINRVME